MAPMAAINRTKGPIDIDRLPMIEVRTGGAGELSNDLDKRLAESLLNATSIMV